MGEQVRIRREGRVVVATLDHPPHALMTGQMVGELIALAAEVEQDASVGAVVVHGAHPERFIAHFDVAELQGYTTAPAPALSRRQAGAAMRAVGAAARVPGAADLVERSPAAGVLGIARFHELILRMHRAGVTFIAAIDGSALGGGCELSLACDLRYMADGDFLIGQPEVLIGIIPGGGGTQHLVRLLGTGRAVELVLEGATLRPAQALEIGLVHRVFPAERLLDEARAGAERLARRPRAAVAAAKRAIWEGGSLPLPRGLQVEGAAFLESATSPAAARAMRAYVELLESTGDVPAYDPAFLAQGQAGTFIDLTDG